LFIFTVVKNPALYKRMCGPDLPQYCLNCTKFGKLIKGPTSKKREGRKDEREWPGRGRRDDGNVTSAGWQVTLCALIWHESSCCGEAIANCYTPFTLPYLYLLLR